jgi:hypothetical protein
LVYFFIMILSQISCSRNALSCRNSNGAANRSAAPLDIDSYAKSMGASTKSFVRRAIEETMERYKVSTPEEVKLHTKRHPILRMIGWRLIMTLYGFFLTIISTIPAPAPAAPRAISRMPHQGIPAFSRASFVGPTTSASLEGSVGASEGAVVPSSGGLEGSVSGSEGETEGSVTGSEDSVGVSEGAEELSSGGLEGSISGSEGATDGSVTDSEGSVDSVGFVVSVGSVSTSFTVT